MRQVKATNITKHKRMISSFDIENRNGHKGCVVWLTGLSAAGKSTIAVQAEKMLFDMGYNVYLLDGDNIRHSINKDLGFSPEDREENIRRISEVARLFRNAGHIVLNAFISPYRSDRDQARELVEPGRFCEVYVKCSVDECKRRDPKGLYEKAMLGQIKEFTGVSAPYEEPLNPELVIDTEHNTIDDSVDMLIRKLREMRIIKP
ncbi:MAG: adenylyl-sulfate kinase [Candidatus Kapaibacterium sp.]